MFRLLKTPSYLSPKNAFDYVKLEETSEKETKIPPPKEKREGTIFFANGNQYCGELEYEEPNGYGALTVFQEGKKMGEITGTWNSGVFQSCHTFKNHTASFDVLSTVYHPKHTIIPTFCIEKTERFKFALPNQINYSNGNKYIGDTQNNLPHGKGTAYHYEAGCIYGTWVLGNLQISKCHVFYPNEDSYIGDFQHGQPHGFGTLHYGPIKSPSGSIQGYWEKGELIHCTAVQNNIYRKDILHKHYFTKGITNAN